jgi:hypothetical protein
MLNPLSTEMQTLCGDSMLCWLYCASYVFEPSVQGVAGVCGCGCGMCVVLEQHFSIPHNDKTCWILTHYLYECCWIGVVSHSTLRYPVARYCCEQ